MFILSIPFDSTFRTFFFLEYLARNQYELVCHSTSSIKTKLKGKLKLKFVCISHKIIIIQNTFRLFEREKKKYS